MLKVRNAGSKTVTDAHLLKSQSLCEAMTPSFLFLSKLITPPSSKFDAEEISYPSRSGFSPRPATALKAQFLARRCPPAACPTCSRLFRKLRGNGRPEI